MFDNIASNKYFIIALIIAIIVLLYLYSQKKSCEVEKMQNITTTSADLVEYPWADNDDEGKYKSVNKKSSSNGSNTKRTDELYKKYIEDGNKDLEHERTSRKTKRKNLVANIPQPLDDRPDLAQCQPCICPKNRNDEDYDDTSDSDDYDYRPKRRTRKN